MITTQVTTMITDDDDGRKVMTIPHMTLRALDTLNSKKKITCKR